MELKEFLAYVNQGLPIKADSEVHLYMTKLSCEAMRITAELNNSYNEPSEIRKILSKLFGKEVDESVRMFPPFNTDCGKNTTLGKNVFINAGCKFQDQGGITIGDGTLIGHNVVLATLNHSFAPIDRGTTIAAPIVIGKNVWIGSNATILPGVMIGDNSVIAAGAVVTRNIEENVVAGGVPAKVIKSIFDVTSSRK